MERKPALTEKTQSGFLEVFIMLGDYGLPERSHLLVPQDKSHPDNNTPTGEKNKDLLPQSHLLKKD